LPWIVDLVGKWRRKRAEEVEQEIKILISW
jgi:hypothetical protein